MFNFSGALKLDVACQQPDFPMDLPGTINLCNDIINMKVGRA